MTDPQTITQLIEDLQAAEVGTRELDARISLILGQAEIYEAPSHFPDGSIVDFRAIPTGQIRAETSCQKFFHDYPPVEPFSTSIDAAMTTIREGFHFLGVSFFASSYRAAVGEIKMPDRTTAAHKSIPLAICIASLYAILKELETT